MKKILFLTGCLFIAFSFGQAGNVGINTNAPTEKLDVNGSMRFEPSSIVGLAAGQVLVSDKDGNATWRAMDLSVKNYGPSYGTTGYTVVNYYDDDNSHTYPDPIWRSHSRIAYTGTSITLPQGKWLVIFNNIANVEFSNSYNANGSGAWNKDLPGNIALWVRTYFADNTTEYAKGYNHDNAVISSSIVGPNKVSNAIIGPSNSMQISGEQIINNNSGGAKTYYLKVSTQLFNVAAGSNVGVRLVDFALNGNTINNYANKMIAYKIQ